MKALKPPTVESAAMPAVWKIDNQYDFDERELAYAEETLATYAELDGVSIRQCAYIRRAALAEADCLGGYDDTELGRESFIANFSHLTPATSR